MFPKKVNKETKRTNNIYALGVCIEKKESKHTKGKINHNKLLFFIAKIKFSADNSEKT